MDETAADLLAALEVRPEGDDGAFLVDPPDWYGDYVFGGVVLAQAIAAATRVAPEGRRLHSLHAYFLRPVNSGGPVTHRLRPLREGRSFSSFRLESEQHGKAVLDATCSLTADGDGFVYDLPPRSASPGPEEVPVEPGEMPFDFAWVGPTDPAPDGTRTSTHRHWFRFRGDLPNDLHLHTALFGYASDWTGIGGRPLRLEGDTTGMVSLDHAVWFHRPARADDWHLIDVHSLVNAGGRGLLRNEIRDREGRLVVSMAQEMLLATSSPRS